MSSSVSRPPAADSSQALAHFESLLEFETDCWDVHHAITNNRKDFVLLDVRGEELFNNGNIQSAKDSKNAANMACHNRPPTGFPGNVRNEKHFPSPKNWQTNPWK